MVVFATRISAHHANSYCIGVVALNIGSERAAAAHADGHRTGHLNAGKPWALLKVYFDSAKGRTSTYNEAWDMQ